MMFSVYMLLGIVADEIEWRANRIATWATRRAWMTRTGRRAMEADR